MSIDVGKAISELLFEHQTVIVPGLGGFTTSPEPATVDYVQGVVTPPAKKIEFNPNLVLNDGVLVGHIQKRDVVTAQQAKEAMEAYVNELKAALERREIIEIPNVGRIYRDYEQKLKFMPEGTNFEANAFGLPGVKFAPVNRVKEAPTSSAAKPAPASRAKAAKVENVATAAAASAKATAKKTTAASPNWLNKLLPVLIALAVILLMVSLFFILREGKNPDRPVADAQPEKLNVNPPSPSVDEGEKAAGENASTGEKNGGEGTSETGAGNGAADVKTTPPPAAVTKDSFIVIHSFGVVANAKKFERKLKKDGFGSARSTKQNGLYRVGVQFEHHTQKELDDMVARLGKKYKSTPRVVGY